MKKGSCSLYEIFFSVIKKEQFKETKNDSLDPEPFVECSECGRRLHQICVLHLDCIWQNG